MCTESEVNCNLDLISNSILGHRWNCSQVWNKDSFGHVVIVGKFKKYVFLQQKKLLYYIQALTSIINYHCVYTISLKIRSIV